MSEHEPETPETPETSETPDAPEEVEAPDTPEEVEAPEEIETPEAPAAQGMTAEEAEAAFKKIEAGFKAYSRKVGDAFGDEAVDLLPCPVCSDTVPGFVNKHAVGQFPDEVRRQVMRFLGFATAQEYAPSQTVRACGPCEGKGKVTTGSTVAGHEAVVCPSCTGYGYVPPPTVGAATVAGGEVVPFAPAPLAPVGPQEDVDEWGEPLVLPDGRENPNYGKMPHRKLLIEPWGVTAGLRATPEYVPVPGEVI